MCTSSSQPPKCPTCGHFQAVPGLGEQLPVGIDAHCKYWVKLQRKHPSSLPIPAPLAPPNAIVYVCFLMWFLCCWPSRHILVSPSCSLPRSLAHIRHLTLPCQASKGVIRIQVNTTPPRPKACALLLFTGRPRLRVGPLALLSAPAVPTCNHIHQRDPVLVAEALMPCPSHMMVEWHLSSVDRCKPLGGIGQLVAVLPARDSIWGLASRVALLNRTNNRIPQRVPPMPLPPRRPMGARNHPRTGNSQRHVGQPWCTVIAPVQQGMWQAVMHGGEGRETHPWQGPHVGMDIPVCLLAVRSEVLFV